MRTTKKPAVTLKSLEAELLEIFRRLGPIENEAQELDHVVPRVLTYALQDNLRADKRDAAIAEAEKRRDKAFASLEAKFCEVVGIETGFDLKFLGDTRMAIGNVLRRLRTPNI